jgi:hypothetical protein
MIALAMAGLLPLTSRLSPLTFHRSRLTWINEPSAGFGYDFVAARQEANMRMVKYALVSLFLFAGVAFFYAGMGIEIPEVQFREVNSYGAALGIGFIVFAVVVAGFRREGPSSRLRC